MSKSSKTVTSSMPVKGAKHTLVSAKTPLVDQMSKDLQGLEEVKGSCPSGTDLKKQESGSSGNELLQEQTTAWNTDAVLSVTESEDLGSLEPLEDFNWDQNFPEYDVVDLPVQQYGRTIHLKSKRYPVAVDTPLKAVIFTIHGYGSWSEATIASYKHFAEAGYEVFAADMRGMGDSEGERGIIEKTDDIYNDVWLLVFESIKKFQINQQKTPIFLMGRSFGGLIATNLANTTIGRALFSGVILLTPYYRLFTERLYSAYKFLKPLVKVHPNYTFECEYAEQDPEYYAKYKTLLDDSRWVSNFTAMTATIWVEEQEKAKSVIPELPMPLCFIIASSDGVVRNDTIE